MSATKSTAATRVRPVFQKLHDTDPTGRDWLGPLLRLGSRAEELAPETSPEVLGSLVQPPQFDYTAPVPLDYLESLVKNPRWLKWPKDAGGNPHEYRPAIDKRRRALMAGNVPAQQEAIREIRVEQAREEPDPKLKGWWVLEGASSIDCALFAEGATVFIEGKREEKSLKVHTNWYERRLQIYRNLDCLRVAPGRAERYYLLLVVEEGTPIQTEARAMSRDFQAARPSWPHLDPEAAAELWSHFLGYTTWQQVAAIPGVELPA